MPHTVTALNLHHNQALRFSAADASVAHAKKQLEGRQVPDLKSAFSAERLSRGEPFTSIGSYDGMISAPVSGNWEDRDYYINKLVVKSPGTEEHVLPNELTHLIEAIHMMAVYETALRGSLKHTIGMISVSSGYLTPALIQNVREYWHTAKMPTKSLIIDSMLNEDIPVSTLMLAGVVRNTGVHSQYRMADNAPDTVQMSLADHALAVTEQRYAYALEAPAFAHRQAEPYEIMHGTAYSYHSPSPVKKEEIGERRTSVILTYIPTIG